jgi:signal transduction histidine kinase
MVGLSFFSVKRVDALIDFSNKADHSNFILRDLYTLHGFIKDLDRTERGYMITRDTIYSNGLYKIEDSIRYNFSQLKKEGKDDTALIKDLSYLAEQIKVRCDYIHKNFALVDSTQSATLSELYFDGRTVMRNCNRIIIDLENDEKKTFNKVYSSEHFYMQVAGDTLKYLLFIFFFITTALFLLMLVEVQRRIKFQFALQRRLQDLRQSQMELEQIALSASHDLREPLRKIRVFINRLLWLKKDQIDEESKSTFERVNKSALKMQELIEDLVNLTSLSKEERTKEWVDTDKALKSALLDLDEKIRERKMHLQVEELGRLYGYKHQVCIIFRCLIDYSLGNFTADQEAEIKIYATEYNPEDLKQVGIFDEKRKFKVLVFKDNGMGFEQYEGGKLFQVLKHLNERSSSYDGKGVTMAICQRIMSNHEGYILVENSIDKGMSFKLYFPINE